jgi:hypothetical protein
MSKIEVNQISSQCGSTLTVGQSGDTVTLAAGATQTGFGRTGTVDWDTTPKTATFSAVSGNGYFCNTSGGVFTVNLPAGSAGAIVSLADYAATWQTNNLTVTPNGTDKIGSLNVSVSLSTEGQSVTFVYVDGTQGWINTMDSTSNVRGSTFVAATGGTITTVCTDYKVHTFTGPGTFTVTNAGTPAGSTTVDYMVIAGGGAGGEYSGAGCGAGGGGGAGGFRESSGAASGCYTASPLGACVSALPVTATGYPITVGAGGVSGSSGSNSIFSSITSAGGGKGALSAATYTAGDNGGSGGGAGAGSPGATGSASGGTGNTPPVSPPQGNNGGTVGPATGLRQAAGGGGSTAIGTSITGASPGGPGGAGATTSISGSPTAYAGGGGGGSGNPTASGTGSAGGGNGATDPAARTDASVNSGSGGGGGGDSNTPDLTGGSGGSGIVIIRYKFQ